ncbi:serine dehydratase subunit alpha family protein [Fusibacter sp. 3D3]|uniref:L-cysteine desulfidase family protein n=1 Tax=Fusibacter sp. 3D3 TaxID=1048380 RepID=UPI0008529217|nr:L-serine ammonia-lyase, iron-sulfur-dependent, subunit alpha [Fusibacter sp. 3D3]GAU76817.1 inner membrane protein [Fusibacter sp. 3D3]
MNTFKNNPKAIQDLILSTLQKEVVPAMGCTEPVAVALAVAKAKELLKDMRDLKEINVSVSPNIYKNGLAVGIPGTREVGLAIAAALGYTSGKSENDLKVLSTVTDQDVQIAKDLIVKGILKLDIKDTPHKIDIEVTIKTVTSTAKVIIMHRHNQFVFLSTDQQVILDHIDNNTCTAEENPLFNLSVSTLIENIEHMNLDSLAFLIEGATMNRSVAEYGLTHQSGMQVGRTLKNSKALTDDLSTRAMILTAGASDARMDGVSLPVMSSNGSGNNGLTAILPIVAYSELHPVDDDHLAKAIAMSHIVNSYIKNAIGRLSALCGCGVAAGTGASVGLAWLMGATQEQLGSTIKNMLANTSGMICDGAKVGCSLKLATSAQAAVQSAILSIADICVPTFNGIIGDTVERTIDNLRILSNEGMMKTDEVMLSIMKQMQSEILTQSI